MNPPVRNSEPIDRHRRIATIGRAVVLACAAILSFSALYDLAILCGYRWWQAALFPIMVDAGVAVALTGWKASGFARRMTIALLSTTLIGNATAHILTAYHLQPHWAVVVLVGGLAPAVLASTWWLTHRPDELVVELPPTLVVEEPALVVEEPAPVEVVVEPATTTQQTTARDLVLGGAGRTKLMKELGLTDHQARQAIRTHRPATNGQVVA